MAVAELPRPGMKSRRLRCYAVRMAVPCNPCFGVDCWVGDARSNEASQIPQQRRRVSQAGLPMGAAHAIYLIVVGLVSLRVVAAGEITKVVPLLNS